GAEGHSARMPLAEARMNGGDGEGEAERGGGGDEIDGPGGAGQANEKTAQRRAGGGGELERAAVPGDGVGENLGRHEQRQERSAGRAVERLAAACGGEQGVDDEYRDVEIRGGRECGGAGGCG